MHRLFTTTLCALALTSLQPACAGPEGPSADAPKQDLVRTAISAGSFKTLAAALEAADLVGALQGKGPFTVFAPTDAAFAKLPKGTLQTLLEPANKGLLRSILTYHVVPGALKAKAVAGLKFATTLNGQRVSIDTRAGVKVAGAKVIKTDLECSNGVIHVLDSVILPRTDSILQTALKAGSFKTLAAAIKHAGLVKALSGQGPFTVFAPTDAAFASLPKGTLTSLLQPENKAKLQAILSYHVVPGRIYADQALAKGSAKTLQGQQLRIRTQGKLAKVNQATLLKTDLEASNGVIHVIDQVLLPPLKSTKSAGLYGLELKDIEGQPVKLERYRGKVLLVVNTASRCGYTGQYAGLEKLYQRYKARGLVVLGFPCNDFGGQEPGTELQIKRFCSSRYGVSFPMFSKLHVKGSQQAKLYGLLTRAQGPVRWNFTKFLVDRQGKILARYESHVGPEGAQLTKAIEAALGRSAAKAARDFK